MIFEIPEECVHTHFDAKRDRVKYRPQHFGFCCVLLQSDEACRHVGLVRAGSLQQAERWHKIDTVGCIRRSENGLDLVVFIKEANRSGPVDSYTRRGHRRVQNVDLLGFVHKTSQRIRAMIGAQGLGTYVDAYKRPRANCDHTIAHIERTLGHKRRLWIADLWLKALQFCCLIQQVKSSNEFTIDFMGTS